MSLQLYWFIPSHGDGREVARPRPELGAGAAAVRREPDTGYLVQVAQAADRLGFAGALVPFGLICEDPWLVSAALSRETARLRFLVAFRPGLSSPTLTAQMAATCQRISGGRLLLNVVTGGDPAEQHRYGDWLAHDQRYARAEEFLAIMRGAWSGKLDLAGDYHRVAGATVFRRPDPPPPIFLGGSSEAARRVAVAQADVYLSWAELPEQTAKLVAEVRAQAFRAGRTLGFGTRLHVITRDTPEAAWAVTEQLTAHLDPALVARTQQRLRHSDSEGQRRMAALHGGRTDRLEIYPNLWVGHGLARQGPAVTLVGSHEEVADRIAEYHAAGLDHLILSGQPHLEEAYWFAEGVMPILRRRGLLPAEPGGPVAPVLAVRPGPAAQPAVPAPVDPAYPRTYLVGPPHGEFARRRREAPVGWVEATGRRRRAGGQSALQRVGGFWAVTRHESVVAAARAPELFSSSAQGAFLADPASREDLERARQLLVGMDPPAHTRLRQVVTSAFTPAAVRGMRASIAGHARRIVSRALRGHALDAVVDLAAELPLLALADLLGVARQDRHLFLRWSNHLVGFDDPAFGGGDVAVFKQALAEAFGYAVEIGEAKRRDPGDDLVSRLVTAEVDGAPITEQEFCHLWLLLVVAGNETTRHLISGGLDLLADRPELAGELAADAGLIPGAVEELLRWLTPIMQFRRTATRDTELAGQRIGADDKVVLYYVSANRDESVFADPDRFDPRRRPNPHLAFGAGPHFCLGAQLARLEAAVLFQELAPHLPRLTRTGPAVRLESNFMNGLRELPIGFG